MMDQRTFRIVLGVSLTLNAFLAAFAISVVITPGLALRAVGPAWRRAAHELDPVHRVALVNLMRADGRRLQPQTQEARSLRREVWAALQAPGFDPVAAKGELAQARALSIESRGVVENDLVDFAATLPADQRAALGRAFYRMTPPVRPSALSRRRPDPASPAPGSSPAPRSPG